MGLLSEKNKEVLLGPLSANNPVVVQMLGICSALAVTSKLEPAIVMGISVTAVVAFANVIISLMRNTIPNRIRIIVQLVVVAALVTIVSEVLKAFAYDVNKQLSVFVGLIITNCILMGRLEAILSEARGTGVASGSDCQQQHLSDKATGRTVKRVQCKRKIKPELYLCCFIKKGKQ